VVADELSGKRVVVMGFARQGQALARWLPAIGARVTVTDARPETAFGESLAPYRADGVAFVLGGHPLSLLDDADVLCVSGGVPLTAPLVAEALRRGVPVTNDAQLFLARCPARTIGITGSAGKTTTTSLVGAMCRAAGRMTHVGGNIGDVLLDVLPAIRPSDMVVMELSSFQLELATASPPLGAILNITPNHLDRHGTLEAYTAAKANLIRFQGPDGLAILGRDDPGAAGLAGLAPGRVVWFSAREAVIDGAYLAGERLVVSGVASPDSRPQTVLPRAEIPLRGAHNVLNALAACAIAGAAGVPPETLAAAIRSFRSVSHRLEVVRVREGVTWVNDGAGAGRRAQLRRAADPAAGRQRQESPLGRAGGSGRRQGAGGGHIRCAWPGCGRFVACGAGSRGGGDAGGGARAGGRHAGGGGRGGGGSGPAGRCGAALPRWHQLRRLPRL